MKLEPADLDRLATALEMSFDSIELDRLLSTRFGKPYRSFAGENLSDAARTWKLADYFQRRSWTEQLVAAAREARGEVADFVVLADKVGLTAPVDRRALQALIRAPTAARGNRAYRDPEEYRLMLAACEDAVCRVHVDGVAKGTGTLIADTLVLTNQHVIAAVLGPGLELSKPIVCHFDGRRASKDYETPTTIVGVSAVLAASSPAPEDLVANGGEPDPARLDYALLRIERGLADVPIVAGGKPRGALQLPRAPIIPEENEGIVVIQHPAGDRMKLDTGAITKRFPARLHHSVSTEHGSSGAPLIDASGTFVGLHHAGYEWPEVQLPYNQAIPTALIVSDLRLKAVAL